MDINAKEQQAVDAFLRSISEARGVVLPREERSFFDERGKLIAVVPAERELARG